MVGWWMAAVHLTYRRLPEHTPTEAMPPANGKRKMLDLRLPAGNRLEALKGDGVGSFPIRVNGPLLPTLKYREPFLRWFDRN